MIMPKKYLLKKAKQQSKKQQKVMKMLIKFGVDFSMYLESERVADRSFMKENVYIDLRRVSLNRMLCLLDLQ